MTYHRYTPEQLDFIKRHRTLTEQELARQFNAQFKLKVSKDALAQVRVRRGWLTGRTGNFTSANAAWNKGMSYQAGGRSQETQFKPGNRPHTWVPVGTVAVGKSGYLKKKIKDDPAPGQTKEKNWVYIHQMTWEQHHGRPVPHNHLVRFRDGDHRNFDPANLVLVSRAENLVINRWLKADGLPPGGFDVLLKLARLTILMNKRKKELE